MSISHVAPLALLSLFQNEELSDIRFTLMNKTGQKVSIAAHKILLASSSPVFMAMFFGRLKEGSSVAITDVSFSTRPWLH